MSIGDWLGVDSLLLAVPVGVSSIFVYHWLVAYLENRKLIKSRATRHQALQGYKRILEFKEGRRDRYPFYIMLSSVAVLCCVAACTIILAVLLIGPIFATAVIWFGIAAIISIMSPFFLIVIYQTARHLERFEEYKMEVERQWGPIEEVGLKDWPLS
jgi:hypothetical protein